MSSTEKGCNKTGRHGQAQLACVKLTEGAWRYMKGMLVKYLGKSIASVDFFLFRRPQYKRK